MAAQKGNKLAEKHIDWDFIDSLLKIACNAMEISAMLGVSDDTLNNHCKKEKGYTFSDYIKRGMSDYKIGIRRAQYRSAMGVPKKDDDGNVIGWLQQPSVAMQIFLGKNYLGQSDKQDITTGGEKIQQVVTYIDEAQKRIHEKMLEELTK